MILRKFYIRQDQDQDLAELPGNKAEHVRAALDMYLPEKKQEVLNVSESSSNPDDLVDWFMKRRPKKGDEKNGKSEYVSSASEEE